MMSFWLIVLVTGCYLITGILQAGKGEMGFGLMWLSYGLANIGLMMAGGAK